MLGTRQPTSTTWYRFVAIGLIIGVVGLAAITGMAQPASGQADLQLGTLDVADTNDTITGDIQTAELTTTLDYQHDVPNADRRLINLAVRPEGGSYERVTFAMDDVYSAEDSGSVSLSGDLLEHSEITAADLQPDAAGTNTTTDIDVRAEIEVRRSTGDPVTKTVEDTATITVTDGTELTAQVGGTGSIDLTTA